VVVSEKQMIYKLKVVLRCASLFQDRKIEDAPTIECLEQSKKKLPKL